MHNRGHRGEVAEPGLRRTPGTRVGSKGSRGFESPPLRQRVTAFRDSPLSSLKIAAFRANLHFPRHQRPARPAWRPRCYRPSLLRQLPRSAMRPLSAHSSRCSRPRPITTSSGKHLALRTVCSGCKCPCQSDDTWAVRRARAFVWRLRRAPACDLISRRGCANYRVKRSSFNKVSLGARRAQPGRITAARAPGPDNRVVGAREERPDSRDVARLMHDQLPFHFTDPYDLRIPEFEEMAAPTSYAPAMLRHFANQAYGGFDAEAELSSIRQPVLVLAGRHDRTCSVEAAEMIARRVPKSELVIFEQSGHLPFVEEQKLYLEAVRNFLDRYTS
jgi:pimeloyl-ACP methyl ester carboxylesterase